MQDWSVARKAGEGFRELCLKEGKGLLHQFLLLHLLIAGLRFKLREIVCQAGFAGPRLKQN